MSKGGKDKSARKYKRDCRNLLKSKIGMLFNDHRRLNDLTAELAGKDLGITRNVWNQLENCAQRNRSFGLLFLRVEALKKIGYDLENDEVRSAIQEEFDFLIQEEHRKCEERISSAEESLQKLVDGD